MNNSLYGCFLVDHILNILSIVLLVYGFVLCDVSQFHVYYSGFFKNTFAGPCCSRLKAVAILCVEIIAIKRSLYITF